MKKLILTAQSILLFAGSTNAQQKFRLGVAYNLSASSMSSSGNMSGMGGSGMSNGTTSSGLGWKLNPGTAIRAEYYLNNKWGVYLQTGYQQRGGVFKGYMDDYKPRYRLNYWDVNLGAQFRTKQTARKFQFITNLGVTQHSLLSAFRVYDTGSDNIMDEFKSIDIGLYLAFGGNISVFEKDIFQVMFFGNFGFSQMYSGDLEMNGMMGRNQLLGIQLAYLIGKPTRQEQNMK